MNSYHIIDSNVIAIANGLHGDASIECMQSSISFLKRIEEIVMRKDDVFFIYDTSFVILNEYFKHCGKGTEQKLGTVFYKWIHRNFNNSNIITQQNLPIEIENNDELLPPCFDGFDRNDRKYLILALQFKEFGPNLHYSIDRGYQRYSHCFEEQNIQLSKLC